MARRWGGAAAAAVALAAACGGKAVVDGMHGTGGAAMTGSGGTTSTTKPSSGANGFCANQDPVGKVSPCPGGMVSVGSGMAPECASDVCDEKGVAFESDCQGQTCRCKVNNVVACTCSIDVGQLCGGGAKSCCPTPFPP